MAHEYEHRRRILEHLLEFVPLFRLYNYVVTHWSTRKNRQKSTSAKLELKGIRGIPIKNRNAFMGQPQHTIIECPDVGRRQASSQVSANELRKFSVGRAREDAKLVCSVRHFKEER
jgi:hypothetical protein